MKPVFAFTPVEQVWNQLALTWGIQPVLVQMVDHTDAMTRQVDSSLEEMGLVQDGDLVVIAAGSPPGKAGSTNMASRWGYWSRMSMSRRGLRNSL